MKKNSSTRCQGDIKRRCKVSLQGEGFAFYTHSIRFRNFDDFCFALMKFPSITKLFGNNKETTDLSNASSFLFSVDQEALVAMVSYLQSAALKLVYDELFDCKKKQVTKKKDMFKEIKQWIMEENSSAFSSTAVVENNADGIQELRQMADNIVAQMKLLTSKQIELQESFEEIEGNLSKLAESLRNYKATPTKKTKKRKDRPQAITNEEILALIAKKNAEANLAADKPKDIVNLDALDE